MSREHIGYLDSAIADRPLSVWSRLELSVVSLVVHFLALALPLALLQIYDRILPNQSTGTVAFLVIGVSVAIFLEAVLRYGRSRFLASVGARFDARVPVIMVRRLLAADLRETDKRGAAVILDGFRSLGQVREFWSGNAAVSLYEVPFVLVYIILIYYIGGVLALIPAAAILFALLLALAVRSSARKFAAGMEAADRKRHDFLWNLVQGVELVKAFGGERVLTAHYGAMSAHSMASSVGLEARNAVLRESGIGLGQLSTVLVVSFGALMVLQGELTTGGLAACSILAGRSLGPALAGLGYVVRMGQVRDAERRVNDILTLPAAGAHADKSRDGAPNRVPGDAEPVMSIRLSNGKDLRLRTGEIVGVQSEKPEVASDVLAAAAGLRDDPGIAAEVFGRSVHDLDPSVLRQKVAYVPERSAILPGSVLNNLTLYDPRFNAEARALSDRLGLSDYLGRLRHGILTAVGTPSGAQLDEGIVQRIGLVRALVRGPAILLLDQADDALDLDGERRLAELLGVLKGDMAVLIFSARPAIRDLCDRIETV